MMDANKKRWAWAAGLSLLLILFWSWRSQVRSRHEADKALFQAYLQGPLSDLLYGVSRSLPGLATLNKPSPGLSAALKEGEDSLLNSVAGLDALLDARAPGPWTQSLAAVLESHQAMAKLSGRWAGLTKGGKPALAAYLKDEADLRLRLCDQIDTLRSEALKRQRWTRSEVLELNALLHSLRKPLE